MRKPPPKRKNEIANLIRWSKTRKAVFEDCKRKYYLRYYHHWGGWKETAPPSRRLAYRLGKMVTMPILVGSAVHEVLAAHFRALANGQYRPLKTDAPVKIMRRVWTDSRNKLWEISPKKYPPLFEIYYDRIPSREKLVGYADKARRTVEVSTRLALYRELRELDRKDFLWIDPAGGKFSERVVFDVPPYQAIAIPDLVYRRGDSIILIDWKTGRPSPSDRLQMEAGAIWARSQPAMKDGSIRALLVYLETGEITDFHVGDDQLRRTAEKIRGDMESMLAYVKDASTNTPREKEAFPEIENRNFCRHCEFQELCFNYFQPENEFPAGNN